MAFFHLYADDYVAIFDATKRSQIDTYMLSIYWWLR